jgi:hypothetical protein
MAQTGFTPIQLYSTSTAAAAPVAGNLTNSTLGSELAINITDGKLFYKDNANAVQVIGWKTVPTTAGGTGLTTYTAGDLSYYATGTTFTKLAIGTIGQILTSTGSAPQWSTLSGVAVTTFSAGTTGFTPNSATSGAITLAGTLITSNGGTGLSSYTAGDLSYYASGTALTKLAIGATGRFLSSTGSAPQWNAPAALTKTDDTNVTLTLGGSASTALLNAASLALGWTGTLATTRGGTGLSSFTANGVMYASSTSALATASTLLWDGTNLAIGPTSPVGANRILEVGTGSRATTYVRVQSQNAGLVTVEHLNAGFGTFYTVMNNSGSAFVGIPNAMGGIATDSFPIVIAPNATERARFFTSGGVSIGNTTDPGAGSLIVNSEGRFGSGLTIGSLSDPNSTFLIGGAVLSSGAGTHFLKWNNSTGLVTYDTSSRLVKTDIEDSPYGLAEILKLKPRKYFRTDDQRIEHGLIADEVVDIMPEYVPMVPKSLLTKDDDDTELVPGGVNYERIVAPLINAIHELNAQIDALKLQIGK